MKAHFYRIRAIAGLAALFAVPEYAADTLRLTLTEAVHIAIQQNRGLKVARLKVTENQQKKAEEHARYFPTLTNQSNALHITDLQVVEIPTGAFGTAAGVPIPTRGLILPQGQLTLFSSGTQLTQTLTQLVRVHADNRIAAADIAVSRQDVKKAENQVALQVHQLYFGVLIARLQKQAAEKKIASVGEQLRESEEDVRNGSALKIAAIQSRAGLLEAQQTLLTADLQLDDLTTELNNLLGLPLDTRLDLDPAVPATLDMLPRDQYVQTAWSENPEIRAAEEVVRKATAGVSAAKSAYIPDVIAYARHSYQDGVPFLVRNFGTFGLNLNWNVFDFGRRRAVVRQRETQLAQAQENLSRLKEDVAAGIDRSYNRLQRTKNLVQVATQVVRFRQEAERLARNQFVQGVVLASDRQQATAASYQANADLLQASLGYLLAWAELEQAIGRTPGF